MIATEYSLLGPEALVEPYPVYARLRSEAPVHWDPMLQAWLVARHQDVTAALNSLPLCPTIGGTGILAGSLPAEARAQLATVEEMLSRWLTFLPPDGHRRRRGFLAQVFTPALVETLRPRVTRLAEELLAAVLDEGRMDLVRDLAQPLPILVIAELLGFPARDRDRLKAWSWDILGYFQIGNAEPAATVAGMHRALTEMTEALRELIEERRREPHQDLVSHLVSAEREGGRLEEDEIAATAVQLLFAGHETTRNLLGNGIFALLRHPGELARLRGDAALIRSAVEELLRYESPLQLTGRVATRALALGGQAIEEGQALLLLLGSANRDPARFADPDRLDVGREDNRHVAFGVGRYFCLGAALARLEAEVILEVLLRRLKSLGFAPEPATWRPNFAFRGLETLPVVFEVA